jgi:hypothetical protein
LIAPTIILVFGVLLTSLSFYLGQGLKTADTEIWNGEVTSTKRVHGSYVESYQCNCRSVTSGSGKNSSSTTQCDTCYRDHFTVSWLCYTNIDIFRIAHEDWDNRGVYRLPDPPRFTSIKPGDPVAKTNSYTNYIKAVPETLFRPAQSTLKAQFASQIPEYPINVYDIYKINRVLAVGVSIPDLPQWNEKLSEVLKKLGPRKQANAVIVITKSADPNYFYALQDAWQNGKKNDIVVVIGAPEFPKPAWVNIMALTENNIFQVKLRDDILALENLTADTVIGTITKNANETFKRKRMRDFQYLENEIDPPTWTLVTNAAILIVGCLSYWFILWREYGVGRRASKYYRKF